MKIMILAGAVMLAGCAAAPPATQIVQVPVHTPCVKDAPAQPEYEFDKLSIDAPAGDKVMALALARDWVRGRRYEEQLAAALEACLPWSGKLKNSSALR